MAKWGRNLGCGVALWATGWAGLSGGLVACGESDDGDDGACAAADSCGGDVVGTWRIESVCSDRNQLALAFESELPPECAGSFRDGEFAPTDLTFEFGADGTWALAGSLLNRIEYTLDAACLTALAPAAPEPSDAVCQLLADGTQQGVQMEDPEGSATCVFASDGCECQLSYTSGVSMTDMYSVVGNELRSRGELAPYCVSGDTLEFQDGEFGTLVGRRE